MDFASLMARFSLCISQQRMCRIRKPIATSYNHGLFPDRRAGVTKA